MRYLDPERDYREWYRANVNGGCEWSGCRNDAEVYDHEAGTAFCLHHEALA